MPAALLSLILNPRVLGVLGIVALLAGIGVQTLKLNAAVANEKLAKSQLASLQAQERAAAAHSAEVAHTQQEITKAVTGHEAAQQAHIVYVTRTIHDQITVAVPPPVDVFLNNGWVRLYNASAAGVSPVSPSPGEPDASPSAVKASDALSVTIDNFAECHTDQARLTDLQSWVRQVTAVQ